MSGWNQNQKQSAVLSVPFAECIEGHNLKGKFNSKLKLKFNVSHQTSSTFAFYIGDSEFNIFGLCKVTSQIQSSI